MSLSLRQSRALDRRRRRARFVKWIFALAILGGLGVAAYESGTHLARREVVRLDREVAVLRQQVDGLKKQNAVLAGDAGAARLRERDLQRRYAADVPTGDAKALLDLVQQRLKAGVSPDRLKFMIGAATAQPKCDGKPVTKRFIVRTPLTAGANDTVTFADRSITVSASGTPALAANGAPEAWFDPGAPVTLVFTALGGDAVTAKGMLPLSKSVVHNGSEYRFTARIGQTRGFVDVTADRCDFPG